MKELTNRKTGVSYIVNEDEYQSLKENGRLRKFIVAEVEPIRKLIPTTGIIKSEIVVTKVNPIVKPKVK